MEEETIGINMSHRPKSSKNLLIDVEKLGRVVRVGIEYERERLARLASEIRVIAVTHAVKGGPINFEKADEAIAAFIRGENK